MIWSGRPLTISGYAMVWDEPDLGGDIADPFCAYETLRTWQRHGRPLPILVDHNWSQRAGEWRRFDIDDYGLRMTGEVKPAWAKLLIRPIVGEPMRGLSPGYRTVQSKIEGEHRRLERVDIHEFSIVRHPMHKDALIDSVTP